MAVDKPVTCTQEYITPTLERHFLLRCAARHRPGTALKAKPLQMLLWNNPLQIIRCLIALLVH